MGVLCHQNYSNRNPYTADVIHQETLFNSGEYD